MFRTMSVIEKVDFILQFDCGMFSNKGYLYVLVAAHKNRGYIAIVGYVEQLRFHFETIAGLVRFMKYFDNPLYWSILSFSES